MTAPESALVKQDPAPSMDAAAIDRLVTILKEDPVRALTEVGGKTFAHVRDQYDYTLTHAVVLLTNRSDLLEFVLEHGSPMHSKIASESSHRRAEWTAMEMVARDAKLEFCKIFVRYGAYTREVAYDVLRQAAFSGDPAILLYFVLDAREDVSHVTFDLQVFQFVCRSRHLEMVTAYLDLFRVIPNPPRELGDEADVYYNDLHLIYGPPWLPLGGSPIQYAWAHFPHALRHPVLDFVVQLKYETFGRRVLARLFVAFIAGIVGLFFLVQYLSSTYEQAVIPSAIVFAGGCVYGTAILTILPLTSRLMFSMSYMFFDLAQFFMIYVFFLFGFSGAFYLLFHNVDGGETRFGTMGRSILSTFFMLFGDFPSDLFLDAFGWTETSNNGHNGGSPLAKAVIANLLLLTYLLSVVVMLLNILIAMMSSTYSIVTEQTQNFVRTVFVLNAENAMPLARRIAVYDQFLVGSEERQYAAGHKRFEEEQAKQETKAGTASHEITPSAHSLVAVDETGSTTTTVRRSTDKTAKVIPTSSEKRAAPPVDQASSSSPSNSGATDDETSEFRAKNPKMLRKEYIKLPYGKRSLADFYHKETITAINGSRSSVESEPVDSVMLQTELTKLKSDMDEQQRSYQSELASRLKEQEAALTQRHEEWTKKVLAQQEVMLMRLSELQNDLVLARAS